MEYSIQRVFVREQMKDPKYINSVKMDCRIEVFEHIVPALVTGRIFTIQMSETMRENPGRYDSVFQYNLSMSIEPARYTKIDMAYVENQSNTELLRSAFQELKYRTKKKGKAFWERLTYHGK